MIRAPLLGGLVVILVAAGALGVRLHRARAEALVLIRLGDQQFREGRDLKALEIYKQSRARQASPHAQERIRLARDAVQDLSRAIAQKPDYRDAYRARAACYERLGMPDKQQADLRTFQSLPQ
jgi:hypothetical protein